MRSEEISKQEARAVKRAEDRLLEAARKIFGTAYPNPEGTTRTNSGALKAAAARSHRQPLSPELLDELTWSSETFAEYQRYLREARFGRRLRWLAACAAVVMALGAALWWSLTSAGPLSEEPPVVVREEPAPNETPAPRELDQIPEPQPAYELAVLDLRDQSLVRGETEPVESGTELPALPARQVDLTVYLPIGSEEGAYELALARQADVPLATARGAAALVDQNVVLAATMDLSALDPGIYLLGVRRGEFRWAYYQVRVG